MGPSSKPTVTIDRIPEDEETSAGWVEIFWRSGCVGAAVEFPEDRLPALRDALNEYLGMTDANL